MLFHIYYKFNARLKNGDRIGGTHFEDHIEKTEGQD